MIAYGMDKTRRRKVQSKDKRKVVALHKTKNLWLSNKEKLKEDQRKMLEELLSSDNNLDTLVAYTYKLKLQDFYSKKRDYSDACVKVNLKMLFYGKLKMSFFRHPPRKYLYLSCGMKGH